MNRDDNPASASPVDWLPRTIPADLPPRAQYSRSIMQEYQHKDWFIALAVAIERDKADTNQSILLAKFYIFMRHFFPRGLTGDYSHIRGNEVMEQLLSHGQTTPSRHKMGKFAESAFGELERWMSRGSTWRQALEQARAASNSSRAAGNKRRVPWKAPGLHSPAGKHHSSLHIMA